jgi:hypothetical protein
MLCVAAGKAKNKRFQSFLMTSGPLKGRFLALERTMRKKNARIVFVKLLSSSLRRLGGVSIGEADRLKCLKLRPSDLLSA